MKTFRVFIGSTFSDLIEERNALQSRVWPELAKLCEKAGFRFQAIDLRWGISEEAGLDQRTTHICLRELHRCQAATPRPNFIILLGNRYGWRPLPEEIDASEFEAVENEAAGLNLPEASLLREWYVRDDNALPPVYHLRARLPKDGVDYTDYGIWYQYVEHPLRELLRVCADAIPLPESQRIKYERSLTEREILAGALDPAIADAKEHVFAYFREVEAFDRLAWASESEAEARELRKFVDFADATRCDMQARHLLRNLKARLDEALGPDHVRKYQASWADGSVSHGHLDGLCANVLADLTAVIQAEIAKFSALGSLDTEIAAHRHFGELRGGKDRFRGREGLLGQIRTYVGSAEPDRPLVVIGPAGSGKSAVIARACEDARGRFPRSVVLGRFIGATPASVDGRSLLQGLCEELGRCFQSETAVPPEYDELVGALRERLAWATAERPVLVFIDALDQLSETDNARTLAWLPRQLPPHVRVVVSVLEGSAAAPSEASNETSTIAGLESILRRRGKPEDVLPIEDYPRDDAKGLLDWYLGAERRTLTEAQTGLILAAFERCPRPLFLKLAAEEGKRWRSDESSPRMPTADSHDVMLSKIIDQLFDRLSAPSDHGKLLVERALGYLVAARNGLTEDELIGVLSADREFFDAFLARARSVGQPLPPGVESLPVAVWVRLYSDLQPYLATRQADGTTLLAFHHRSLDRAARERFLSTPEISGERHNHLADYFTPKTKNEHGLVQFDPLRFFRLTPEEQRAWAGKLPPEPRPVNIRMVVELPYQLVEVARSLGKDDANSPHWDAVAGLLLNVHFLEAKAEASPLIHELALDLQRVLSSMPRSHPDRITLVLVREALQRDLRFIVEHLGEYPQGLFQCLWNSCWWYDCPEAATRPESPARQPLHSWIEGWRDAKESLGPFSWARSMVPPLLPLGSPQVGIFKGHTRGVHAHAVSPDGQYLATAGGYDHSTRVFRVASGEELLKYELSEEFIQSVAFAPDGTQLAVCAGSEIHLIDAWDAGLRRVLKGHGFDVTAVAFAPDGLRLASGSSDETVVIWDTSSGAALVRLGISAGEVTAVAFSPTGSLLATFSQYDDEVRLWDAGSDDLRPLAGLRLTVDSDRPRLRCLAFSPNGSFLAAGSGEAILSSLDSINVVFVWDIDQGEVVAGFEGHERAVRGLAWLPDGATLASCSEDWTLRFWSIPENCQSFIVRGHDGPVNTVTVSPDGRFAITASLDGTARIWDLDLASDARASRGAPRRTREVYGCAESRTLVELLSSAPDTYRVWDIPSGKPRYTRAVENFFSTEHANSTNLELTCCAFSANGRFVAFGSSQGTVHLWEVGTDTLQIGFQACSVRAIGALAFSADDEHLAIALNSEVQAWKLYFSAGSAVNVLQAPHPAERIERVLWSSDNSHVAAYGAGIAIVYDVWSSQVVQRFFGCGGMAFSPDGKAIAVTEGDVIVADIEANEEMNRLRGAELPYRDIAFSADGQRIAVGPSDSVRRTTPGPCVHLWCLNSGRELARLRDYADVAVVAEGASRFPFRAVCRDNQTVFERAADGRTVAFFPGRFFRLTHTGSTDTVAGLLSSTLAILRLEGAEAIGNPPGS